MAVIVAGFAVIVFGLYQYFDPANQPATAENPLYMPVTDPPVDPNRPDLFGEQRR